jgi:hypothetical protein
MEGYVKVNRWSVVSIVCAALIVLVYLLTFVLDRLSPPPPPHISPLFMASAQLFLGLAALITGDIALKQIRKSMRAEKGIILASIGFIVGGIQTAWIALFIVFVFVIRIMRIFFSH